MMTTKQDLFNQDSICIFTDSSFKKYLNNAYGESVGITAPAYCVYHGDVCIEQGFEILHGTTSQQGELYAMLLGVMASCRYSQFPHIRIFADNQNAVFSVREWIFDWVRKTKDGRSLLGEDGRIKNQPYIMDIIYTILANNIYLELYHVKGHVNIKSYEDVRYSKQLFQRSNPFVGHVDDALIYMLAMGNNTVDEYSTVMLRTHLEDPIYDPRGKDRAVTIGYAPFNMSKYIKLVNKGGRHYD